jgi:hypothetical protein
MLWWNNFVDWFNSTEGWRLISGAIIPFLAIVVAGIIAAGIGRASTRRVIALSDRDARIASVTALLSAARRASVWNTLSTGEQQHVDQMTTEAEIRLRLLAMPGASLASEWTAHEITEMKKNSVSFSFQAEQSLLIVRDRLIEWQGRPNRAKRLFKNDLDSWAYESSLSDQDLVHQQQAWSAQQAAAASAALTPATPLAASTAAPTVPALSNLTTPTAPIAPASAAPARTPSAFTPGRFSRPLPVVSASEEAGTAPSSTAPSYSAPSATASYASTLSPAVPSASAPYSSAPSASAPSSAEPSSAAPSTEAPSAIGDRAGSSETTDDVVFAKPVTASDASKRIDPPQDDITP